jgi:hypothetical protein
MFDERPALKDLSRQERSAGTNDNQDGNQNTWGEGD